MERLKKINIKNIAVFLMLLGITFIVMMQSPLDVFTEKGITGTDSSVFRYMGWMMTEGYVPYRDFFDHKGILLYVINYIGTLLSFEHGIWFLEGIAIFISAYFCYKIAEKRCGMLCASGITFLIFALMNQFFDGGNFTEEYALPFHMIAMYIFLDYFLNEKITKLRLVLCGACFAAVCLLRINMISIWLVFCIMVLIQCLYQKKAKELGGFLLYFLIGCIIFLLPFAIYLLYHHAFGDFIEQYFVFNQMYASNDAYVTASGQWDALKFFGGSLTFLAAFIYLLLSLRHKEKRFFHIGYLCYMALTMLFICMSGQIYRHYGMTLLPALVYPYSLFCKNCRKADWKKRIPYLVTGALCLGVAALNWRILVINTYQELAHGIVFEDSQIRAVVDYIEEKTDEGDTISVYGNRNLFYILSDRKSASKYSYQKPIGEIEPEIMEEYLEELAEAKPKLIIFTIEKDDAINQFLKENHYKKGHRFDYYQIYLYEE